MHSHSANFSIRSGYCKLTRNAYTPPSQKADWWRRMQVVSTVSKAEKGNPFSALLPSPSLFTIVISAPYASAIWTMGKKPELPGMKPFFHPELRMEKCDVNAWFTTALAYLDNAQFRYCADRHSHVIY